MFTPWGLSQQVEKFTRGFSQVFTASHGGYMIAKGFAEKHLSKKAISMGMEYGNYLAFEEDCLWAIPAYELREYWTAMFPNLDISRWNELELSIVRTIKSYYPEYFEEGQRNEKCNYYSTR